MPWMQELLYVSLREIMARKEVFLAMILLASSLSWGCIESPGDGVKVITVGASDSQGHIADFSGSGPTRDGRTKPSVVGPGVNVVSTAPPGLEDIDYLGVYYAKAKGTSLSTPVAAGVAALMIQADKNITPAGVKAAMSKGAVKLNNTQGDIYEEYYQGAGLLNAYNSYEALSNDLCSVEPTRWDAGRWAFISGGKAISPGLDAGADRSQKKLYILAPSDQDWTTKFVFFTDKARTDLSMNVSGPISSWVLLQPLPGQMPANGQSVFGATLTVPANASTGFYSGAIEISDNGQMIYSLPVTARVAAPLNISRGTGTASGTLEQYEWSYYYADVPLGTDQITASLDAEHRSTVDLFLLAPTSEYYKADGTEGNKDVDISNPPSGRWILAVHSSDSGKDNYTLVMERSGLESAPNTWNAGSLFPGQVKTAQFRLTNNGTSLQDLSYSGVRDMANTTSLIGSISNEQTAAKEIDVSDDVKRLSAKMTWDDSRNDLALRIYDPEGNLAAASDGYEALEEASIDDPEPGKWRIEAYGYNVLPGVDQDFELDVVKQLETHWSWVSASGPQELQSGAAGTIDARLEVPSSAEGREISGYIVAQSGNESLEIPVSVMVSGGSLLGLEYANTEDEDQDGFYDKLSLGIGLNVSLPDDYRVEGGLVDCRGNMVKWLNRSARLTGDGTITVDVDGSEIWKNGACGPMRIQSLFLYNGEGEMIGQYSVNMTIDRDPKEFQPPAAYFNGNFSNETAPSEGVKRIRIGVGVTVIRPGTYDISGRLEGDQGEELGTDSAISKLSAGDQTVVLEFNPTKFMMLGRSSRLYLKDLSLSLGTTELERIEEAWSSSEEVDPSIFKTSGTTRTSTGRTAGIVIP